MKKTITIIIVIILALGIGGALMLGYGKVVYKMITVKKYMILNNFEKELCQPSWDRELISVSRCDLGKNILYAKSLDTELFTDSGGTMYLDQNGREICNYGYFMGNDCEDAIKKWDVNYDRDSCKWQTLCSNN